MIEAGYLSQSDLAELSVRQARDIIGRAQTRMDQVDKEAEISGRSNAELKQAKNIVAKGAKMTIREVNEGKIPSSQVRARVDVNSFKAATISKGKPTPLFAVFGKAVANSIEKMLKDDATATRLNEILKVVGQVSMSEDIEVLERIDFYLGQLSERSENWRKKLIPPKAKLVSIDNKKLENINE